MTIPLSTRDPRHAQYKWKRWITRPWSLVEPGRLRRCEHLAMRLQNSLGAAWEVRRGEGMYTIIERQDAVVAAEHPPLLVGRFSPWKQMDLAVGLNAAVPGAYEAALELSTSPAGLFGEDPVRKFYCAVLPDEGQEVEIVLAMHDFVQNAVAAHA